MIDLSQNEINALVEPEYNNLKSVSFKEPVEIPREELEAERRAVSYQVPHTFQNNQNGWDKDANDTIQNWFDICKEYRWRYQYILDRNYFLAGQFSTISIVFSSLLSVFSGIKLWQQNTSFQNASTVVMLVSNTIIAGITTLSKKYIDDSRNEKIKTFVENMDKFLGNLHAQVMVAPVYRVDSNYFIQNHIAYYTDLMTNCPNLTTSELALAKKKYRTYLENLK